MAETSVTEKAEEDIHNAREKTTTSKKNDIRERTDTGEKDNLSEQDDESLQSSFNAAIEQQTHDRPCMSFCGKQTSKGIAKTSNTCKEDDQKECTVDTLSKGKSKPSSPHKISSEVKEDLGSKDNQIKKEQKCENKKSDKDKLILRENLQVQQSQPTTDLESKGPQNTEQKGPTQRSEQSEPLQAESQIIAENKEAKTVIPTSETHKGTPDDSRRSIATDKNAQIKEKEANSADDGRTRSENTTETCDINTGGDTTTITKGLILGEEIKNERNDKSDSRQIDEADMCGKSPTFDRVDSKKMPVEKDKEKEQDNKVDLKGKPKLTLDFVSGGDNAAPGKFQTSLSVGKTEQGKIVNVSPEETCAKRIEIDKGGLVKDQEKVQVEDDTKMDPVVESTGKESNSDSVPSKEPEQIKIQIKETGSKENGVGHPKECKENKETSKEDLKLSNSKSGLEDNIDAGGAKLESNSKQMTNNISKEVSDEISTANNGGKQDKKNTTLPKEQRNIKTPKVKPSPRASTRYGMRKRQQQATVNAETETSKSTTPSKVEKAAPNTSADPNMSADPEKFPDDTNSIADVMSAHSSDSEEDVTSKSNSWRFDSDKETESDKESENDVKFTKRASNDSNFAVVYSFFTIFGGLLNLPECSLDEFEDSLDNCNDLTLQPDKHGLLEKLHLKLLRRLSRSSKTQFCTLGQVSNDRLIKYLIKFSKYADLDLAWDLEKFGYHVLGSSERLLLLKALCEIHFDENPRFKVHYTDEYVKTDNIEAIRLQPTGFDMSGKAIWYQQDNAAGFRIYSVEEDDEDGSSWKLLASNLEDFEHLIDKLRQKSEVNPKDVALVKRKERKEKKKLAQAQTSKEKKGKVKAKKTRKRKTDASDSDSDEEDDNPCAHCYSNKRPDLVLLCDLCDAAYHTLCLRPPLMTIPEGDWHCPYCKQLVLIDELTVRFKDITARKKTIERAAKRAVFDDIKLSNIVELGEDDPNSRRSGRRRTEIDYNFANYDQLITDAITTEAGKAPSQPRTAVPSGSFYGQSTSRKRHRRLNDLDDDSCESSISDYEKVASEPELAPAAIELENAITRGCRRSRRLKRKCGDEEQSESSSSDEESFVRRSTRRRMSTQKTYMEYESDDTPEELITNSKRKQADENDEYVASGSDEDAEEFLPVRSRRVIITDDDDDEIINDDEIETDLEEDEVLREEYEKDVVSDETEDEEQLPELTDEEEIDDADSTSEDDDYDDESDDDTAKAKKRKRRNEEEDGVRRKGEKDIRTIIKSMKEEKDGSSSKITQPQVKPTVTAAGNTPIKAGADTEKGKQIVHADELVEDETCQQGEGKKSEGINKEDREITPIISNDEFKDSVKSDDAKKLDETKTAFDTAAKDDTQSTNDAQVADDLKKLHDARKIDKTKPTEEHIGILAGIKKEERMNASSGNTDAASISRRNEINKKRNTPSPLLGEAEGAEFVKMDEGKTVMPIKSEEASSCWRTYVPNAKLDISHVIDPLKNTMDLSSSRSQSMRYRYPQPVHHKPPEMHPQMHPDMRPHSQQSDLVRPQLYPADFKRPFDPYSASNTHSPTYQPSSNQYPMRPPYQNVYEPRQFYSPNMQYYPMKGPPGYPGYQHTDGKSLWRPQEATSMPWNYPQYSGMQSYGDTKGRSTVPPLHRPYLDMPNPMFSRESNAPSSNAQTARPQKRSLPGSEKPRRTTDAPSHARRPTATESYAAFQNMVISPANESNRKKPKR